MLEIVEVCTECDRQLNDEFRCPVCPCCDTCGEVLDADGVHAGRGECFSCFAELWED